MNAEFFNSFGKRLKYMLDLRDVAQKELASKLGVTESTISKYINSNQFPTVNMLGQICDVLQCSADFLMCRTDEVVYLGKSKQGDIKFTLKNGRLLSRSELEKLITEMDEAGVNFDYYLKN